MIRTRSPSWNREHPTSGDPRRFGSIAVALLVATSAARADESQPTALFFRARELIREGKYAEACPLLEESQRLDPGVGTQFNLARCYELLGRFASAWSLYDEVARTTHATGQSAREAIALERMNAIEPRVAHVAIHANPDASLQITLDDAPLPVASEIDARIDPGPHEIAARAPGKRPWSSRIAVTREAERLTVDVPPLADDAAPAQPPPAQEATPPRATPVPIGPSADQAGRRTQRIVALGIAGGAAVALGLGTFFGVRAYVLAHDANPHCDAAGCDPDGVSLRRSSLNAGDASTVSFIAAGVLAAAAAVVWLTAPSAPRPVTVRLGPSAAIDVAF